MNINLELHNDEDIKYLNQYTEKTDDLLRTAITIGLKSIQMSEVNMNCNSYLEPIREIITESTDENKDKINMIDDKLDALLHIRTNSSRKGRLSENLCIQRLIQQYPEWEFTDVAHVGHEGDCRCKSIYGEILYEFKSYDNNVNREQLKKFYNDLDTTGIKLGIFISNTSGIVGKKNLEWEIINNHTLIIYISNTGFNGHGCILGTELMIALLNNKILEKDNMLLYENYQSDEIYKNLIDSLDDYRKNNEYIIKLKKHIQEYRLKNNHMIDTLERDAFDLLLNSEYTFSKILGLVEEIKSKNNIIQNFNIDDFILSNNFNHKFKNLFIELHKLLINLKLDIHIENKELVIHRSNDMIAKTKTLKNKIQLLIFNYPENLNNFDPLYEEFKDKKIYIELDNNYKILDKIKVRLSFNK